MKYLGHELIEAPSLFLAKWFDTLSTKHKQLRVSKLGQKLNEASSLVLANWMDSPLAKHKWLRVSKHDQGVWSPWKIPSYDARSLRICCPSPNLVCSKSQLSMPPSMEQFWPWAITNTRKGQNSWALQLRGSSRAKKSIRWAKTVDLEPYIVTMSNRDGESRLHGLLRVVIHLHGHWIEYGAFPGPNWWRKSNWIILLISTRHHHSPSRILKMEIERF